MKYAAPLIMENIDGRTLALKWIKPNSTVLEFGCSYGQMTQYMKETLGCKVYIVELNPEAYSEAVQYAEDGVCGDILENKWIEKFSNIKFDYILYIDVLEHLSTPFDVLCASETLLKKEGEILISIPNVAHNDIAYKLIQGQFDYTSDGLLDETHVHLFTKDSLEKMIKDAKYFVKEWKYTIKNTGTSEQYVNRYLEINEWWNNILIERPSGEIYQFVVRLGKASDKNQNIDNQIKFPECAVWGSIYYDAGRGINEQDRYAIKAVLIDENTYLCKDTVCVKNKHITQLRYDMLEGKRCYLQRLCVSIEDKNGIEREKYELSEPIFLDGKDPNIFVPITADEDEQIHLDAIFLVEGYKMSQKLMDELQKRQDIIIQQKRELEQSQHMLQQSKNDVDYQNNILSQYKDRIENYKQYVLDLKVRISDLESEKLDRIEYLRELKESTDQYQFEYEKLSIEYEKNKKKQAEELDEIKEKYQYEYQKILTEFEEIKTEYKVLESEKETMESTIKTMEETIEHMKNSGCIQKILRKIKG